MSIELDNKILSYFSQESNSLVAVLDRAKNYTNLHLISTPGIAQEKIELDALNNVWEAFHNRDLSYRLYFVFINAIKGDYFLENIVWIVPKHESQQIISSEQGRINIRFPTAFLKDLCNTALDDATKSG
ncbi:hypothetical protein [Permianibacter aggregans]|uniref:Uncharacterized protein n=1 Tax=Permianibacter aggregans TaxID=1510150 RepID=A0A4R6ULY5_9GAMM|nr:hypothetical protein [Permianibacter aggregans]QGX40326.1 hypothetical protein E2H98_11840 [Permianibacter aggregans]TDQ44244.1 hypothetical protein EV696_12556 [Permianibacter aggregans]